MKENSKEDGQIIQNNSQVNFKEVLNKSMSKEFTGHKKRVYTLDWNMTGSLLASGSVDCSIKVIFSF